MTSEIDGLLTPRDARPVLIIDRAGAGKFLLLGDHAGNRAPERLAGLGLGARDLDRHIAWDPGVAAIGRSLARMLAAPFVAQRYSRLVIDCNRQLADPDSIMAVSDGTRVPGNENVSSAEREARVQAIFLPYHRAIADLLAARDRAGLSTILVSLHSFAPALAGQARPWEFGVLFGGGDERYAAAALAALRASADGPVGENQPYAFDGVDFTIPEHAFGARRPYVEIEMRQDLLKTRPQRRAVADLLGGALLRAAAACE